MCIYKHGKIATSLIHVKVQLENNYGQPSKLSHNSAESAYSKSWSWQSPCLNTRGVTPRDYSIVVVTSASRKFLHNFMLKSVSLLRLPQYPFTKLLFYAVT